MAPPFTQSERFCKIPSLSLFTFSYNTLPLPDSHLYLQTTVHTYHFPWPSPPSPQSRHHALLRLQWHLACPDESRVICHMSLPCSKLYKLPSVWCYPWNRIPRLCLQGHEQPIPNSPPTSQLTLLQPTTLPAHSIPAAVPFLFFVKPHKPNWTISMLSSFQTVWAITIIVVNGIYLLKNTDSKAEKLTSLLYFSSWVW